MRIEFDWHEVLRSEGVVLRVRKSVLPYPSVPPDDGWFELDLELRLHGLRAQARETWLAEDITALSAACSALAADNVSVGATWDVDADRGSRLRLTRRDPGDDGVELRLWSSGGERRAFVATTLDLAGPGWRRAAATLDLALRDAPAPG